MPTTASAPRCGVGAITRVCDHSGRDDRPCARSSADAQRRPYPHVPSQPSGIATSKADAAVGDATGYRPPWGSIGAVDADHAPARPLAQGRVVGGSERVGPVARATISDADPLPDPETSGGSRTPWLPYADRSAPTKPPASEHVHPESGTV